VLEWDDSRVNLDPFDRWSLLHLGGWYIAGRAGLKPMPAIALMLAWEAVEDKVKDSLPGLFVHPVHDSRINVITDLAVGILGYHLGRASLEAEGTSWTRTSSQNSR
jgi:hypothetical protein